MVISTLVYIKLNNPDAQPILIGVATCTRIADNIILEYKKKHPEKADCQFLTNKIPLNKLVVE